jgi:hypothetical protein
MAWYDSLHFSRRRFLGGAASGVVNTALSQPAADTPPPPPLTPAELSMRADAQRTRLANVEAAFEAYCTALKSYGDTLYNDLPAFHHGFGHDSMTFAAGTSEAKLQEAFDGFERTRKHALAIFEVAGEIPGKKLSWAEMGIDVSTLSNHVAFHGPTHHIATYTGANVTLNPGDAPVNGDLYAKLVEGLHTKAMARAKIWDTINQTLELMSVRASGISGLAFSEMKQMVKVLRTDLMREVLAERDSQSARPSGQEDFENLAPLRRLAQMVGEKAPERIEQAVDKFAQQRRRDRERCERDLVGVKEALDRQPWDQHWQNSYNKIAARLLASLVVPSPVSASDLRGVDVVSVALQTLALVALAQMADQLDAGLPASDNQTGSIVEAPPTAALEYHPPEILDTSPVAGRVLEPVITKRAALADSLRRPEEQSSGGWISR